MKICPNCGFEYKDSVEVCADCGTTLIPKSEYQKISKKYKDWEIVFSTPQLYEAEMVKTNLESAGIESVILEQKDTSFPLGGELGEIKVLVPKFRVEEALMIIEKIENQAEEDEEEDEE
jgi:hypothetical protein